MGWHYVAHPDEFKEGKPCMITVGNKQIGVFYKNGNYYGFLNFCPHAKAPVCEGEITGTLFSPTPNEYDMQHDHLVLRCPWHHWEFSVVTGKSVICSVKERLKTYPVKLEENGVYIEV